MGLIVGAAPGNDVKFDEQRVKGYRNFATKIWNIARFVEMNKPDEKEHPPVHARKMSESDRAEIKELNEIKNSVTANLDAYDFHLASETVYHYVWHTLADKIVEQEKDRLRNGTPAERWASYHLLEHLLLESLKMLHPFMPYITEEAYGIFRPGKMLMVEHW
jgi:valyl-tRNA synthetase